jgi:hypothetical protein
MDFNLLVYAADIMTQKMIHGIIKSSLVKLVDLCKLGAD